MGPQGGMYGGRPDDDMNDSAPLLAHATPDPRFGIPQSASAMSMRPSPSPSRIQLSDDGQRRPSGPGGPGILRPGPGPHGPESDMGVPRGWGPSFNTPGDDDENNVHYGPVPNRVLRRNRTQKKVALFQGHLVLDVDVPSMLLDQCSIREGNEFTKMRYTAVTCDPNDFVVRINSLSGVSRNIRN